MTRDQLAAIVNTSLRTAQEVAAMPVKTEEAIRRALDAAKAASAAIDEFNAQGVYDTLIARLSPAERPCHVMAWRESVAGMDEMSAYAAAADAVIARAGRG